jgi:hypothetical protein
VAKRGPVAIEICSTAFTTLGHAQAKSLGYADLPIAVIPHPFGSRSRDEVSQLAATCIADIAQLACEPVSGTSRAAASAPEPPQRAALIEVPGDLDELYQLFRERRWTDGFPVVPPTAERVERMLRHTSRSPTELVAAIPPAFGMATVERIAVNAVMAGCDPEYLPLLIATVEAAMAPEFNLQGIQATTNPCTPWLIINGPIVKQLNINSGINCLGQGSWANATIGRALRLIMQNIGGALPGDMDRATQGFPGKFSMCCAENDAANPWQPLHVERGYSAEQSTVTVVCAAGTLNMNSHTKNADDLIYAFADTLAHATSNDYWTGGEPWIVLPPEHAEVLANAGLSKAEVKRRLWEESKMKASRMAPRDFMRTQDARRTELGVISPDSMLPISSTPELIGLVVAGGPGTHSVYVPTYGNTRSATRVVASETIRGNK